MNSAADFVTGTLAVVGAWFVMLGFFVAALCLDQWRRHGWRGLSRSVR